jgi:hypothetical protein
MNTEGEEHQPERPGDLEHSVVEQDVLRRLTAASPNQ